MKNFHTAGTIGLANQRTSAVLHHPVSVNHEAAMTRLRVAKPKQAINREQRSAYKWTRSAKFFVHYIAAAQREALLETLAEGDFSAFFSR